MDIIKMTRELGKAIQEDESYIKMQLAKQACDEDKELQDMIGEFNLKKLAINIEAQKEIRDENAFQRLNQEFRKVYGDILKNPNMTKYNETKTEFDELFQEVVGILNLSADGEDPESCQHVTSAGCEGGGCSGCSGCQ